MLENCNVSWSEKFKVYSQTSGKRINKNQGQKNFFLWWTDAVMWSIPTFIASDCKQK